MQILIPLLLTPLAHAVDVTFSASCTREMSCSDDLAKSESFSVEFSVSFAERSAVTSNAATGQICESLYGEDKISCKIEKCTPARTKTASMSCEVSGRILGIKTRFSCHKTCTRTSSSAIRPSSPINGVNGINGYNNLTLDTGRSP